jgi:hypothetical protein
MARGVQWTDTELPGVNIQVKTDAVSRRPRQVGPFTYKSFQEIVATKVRIRVVDHMQATDRNRKAGSAFEVFSHLKGRLVGLYALTRGGLHSKPDPARLFTQTFLSGVIFEDLVFEVVQDGGMGHLYSRTVSAAPDGRGWTLQGVQVEGTDGRRLTVDKAMWSKDSGLVAYGPYSFEEDENRVVGPRGCFLIRFSNVVEIHGPILGGADATLCTPNPSLAQNSSGLPTMALLGPDGGEAWPNLQAIPYVKKLPFPGVPPFPLQAPVGHRKHSRATTHSS